MPWKDVQALILDFGGVLAEDGFHLALASLGEQNDIDPKKMVMLGLNAVYDSGYIIGAGSEEQFLALLQQRSGIRINIPEFKQDILRRFVLRPRVLDKVRQIRDLGLPLAILSDHTDWLDQLDERDGFSQEVDQIFNSYHLGKTKRDPQIFNEVVEKLGKQPSQVLFMDDNAGHIERASIQGLKVFLSPTEELLLGGLTHLLQAQSIKKAN